MKRGSYTDEDFIRLWNQYGSAAILSRELGISIRNVYIRRRDVEKRHSIILAGTDLRSPDFQVSYANNNVRTGVNIPDGYILVASDCHYWPDVISTAHKAFVKVIKMVKPKMVIMNGDVFDGASISRHPVSGWESTPTVKQELEACQERLGEIEKAAKGANLHWTWGNHDMRFNGRLASQVGDTWRGVEGMDLKDHFPRWKFSTSVMVNEKVMIKHRYHNGIHAVYNNTMKSGISVVTGHLHSLKVTPWTDYTGTRYGVDTGTLAAIEGNQFDYSEDSPKNWRSGFAILNFIDYQMMPPELVQVIDDKFYFRGELMDT